MTESWQHPPKEPGLSPAAVHVWRFALDQPGTVVQSLEHHLNAAERARAGRFVTDVLQAHFLVGRGSLRAILSRYVGVPPANLVLRAGELGKPALAVPPGGLRIAFNLSHSHGLAALAVTAGREVGIDVEQLRPIDEMDRIVERYFSPRERAEFATLSPAQRLDAFFRTWTRKEAYLKATGQGLMTPLDAFDVPVNPPTPPRLLRVANRPEEVERWTLRDFTPGTGYAGAIIVEGADWQPRWFDFDPGGDE